MLHCIDRLQTEVSKGEAAFRSDSTVQDAIFMNLTVLGEASKRLSEMSRSLEPDVPWREMARLRDVIIHQYDRVDINEIWDIVRLDVIPLHTAIKGLFETLDQTSE